MCSAANLRIEFLRRLCYNKLKSSRLCRRGRDSMNYTWYEMGWIVLIYSFLGWCAEVAFAAVRHGRFVTPDF